MTFIQQDVSQIMIQFDAVTKTFGGQTLFKKISFAIQKGERCGLVGRNGSGKTTLMRLIIGQEGADSGEISIPKHYTIGYLEQHISFTQKTVLEEAIMGLPLKERDNAYKAEAILFGLGLTEQDMHRAPSELSGGYHLRLHLAKVLLSDPDCLLLDEPTNYLDIVSIRWLQRFLRSWRKEFIIISHDREFMDSVTTHTIALHRQSIRKIKGNTEAVFEQILQEEAVQEKTRVKLEQKKAKTEAYIKRFGAKATKARQAQSKMKSLSRLPTLEKLAQIDDLDFTFTPASFPGKQMLRTSQLTFGYQKDAPPLINDLTLEVNKDDCIAIIGKNGRGKSTLLKLLAEELSPLSGNVVCSPNLQIGYFGQTNIDRLTPSHCIIEEVAAENRNLNTNEVRNICGVMMFSGDLAKKNIGVLSGGERSRVLLAKILAKPCNLLFLDEPTHHLDMESIESLIVAIDEFPGAVIIVTHSEMILNMLPLTKLVVCYHDRQEIIVGDYNDFLNKGGWNDDGSVKESQKEKTMTRQENRKLSAEIVQARSKALKPLDTKISAIENAINDLEEKIDQDNDLLIEASEAEQADLIRKYSKQIADHHREIEKLFQELETFSQQHAELKESFDKQLKELQ